MRTTQQTTGRRFVTLLVIAVMLWTMIPSLAEEGTEIYGVVTVDQVKLRQYASKSAGYWELLPQGWVMTIEGTTTAQGEQWYRVSGGLPSAPDSVYHGYILSDCFRPLTLSETEAWLYNPSQGTIPGTPMNADETAEDAAEDTADAEENDALPTMMSAGGWIVTTVGGVNLRVTPTAGADSLAVMPEGTVLQLNGYLTGWYYAEYEGQTGYVAEIYARTASADEISEALDGEAADEPVTAAASEDGLIVLPGAARAATTATATGQAVVYAGNGETITLRAYPNRTSLALAYLPNGTQVAVTGYDGEWANVIYNLTIGYVLRDNLITVSSAASSTPAAPAAAANSLLGVNFMATVNVGTGTLPLLKEASDTSDSLKSIPNRSNLLILEARSDFSKTIFAGQTGYVDTQLLTFSTLSAGYAPYVIITSQKRVNIREKARTNGRVIEHVTHGNILPLWASPWTNDGYTWYPVTVGKTNAYVRGDTCRLLTMQEYSGQGAVQPGTVSPGAATPSPAPTAAPQSSNVFESLSNALNVRAAATTASKSLGKLRLHNRLAFTGTTTVNGELWYKVVYNGTNAFVMGKFVRVLSAEEAGGSTGGAATPNPTPTPKPSSVIPAGLSEVAYTVKNNIYVRKENTMKSRSLTKIRQGGSYMIWLGDTLPDKNGENYTWYHIEYLNLTGWIRGDLIHVMTQQEWQEAFGEPDPTPAPTAVPVTPAPAVTPTPASNSGLTDIAYTVKNNIFVRKENTMKSTSITKIYTAHSYMNLLGEVRADKNGENYTWYHIEYNNKIGWIRGDLIHVMTNAEWDEEFGVAPTAAPTATPAPENGGASGGDNTDTSHLGPYVAYDILRYGSTGPAVTRLQQALYEQSYLSPSDVTGTYTDATRKAVRTFQADNGLTVDGVAGQLTQATLFGTIAYDTTLYPVEKVNWATASNLWARGDVAMVTDVYTGLSFAAKRYAGGSHADVEPLTAADTAIMCRIYGVSTSQEIAEQNLYQRRPLWVTIAGRSLAASMYGVPHNPGGDTLPDNDYTGQFCIHFVGSKVHRTNEVDAAHQAAINYAYNNAPSKK